MFTEVDQVKGPGYTESGLLSEYVIAEERRSSAFCEEEANRVFSTSQTTNLLALFLGKMISVLVCEMTSDSLRARPCIITKRASWRDLVLVCCMPLKLLESSVFFVAMVITAEPVLGTSSTMLDPLRVPRFREPSGICKSCNFEDLIFMVLAPEWRCRVSACCVLAPLWWR